MDTRGEWVDARSRPGRPARTDRASCGLSVATNALHADRRAGAADQGRAAPDAIKKEKQVQSHGRAAAGERGSPSSGFPDEDVLTTPSAHVIHPIITWRKAGRPAR
jgi:hypothetical protein